MFDNKLSFIPHIKALKAKCLKALDILKVLSSSDWGGDRTVLLNLYRSLIRSKLDYGSIVYGSARKSYLKSLDTIHHQGLRLALGAFRTSPVESLYAESNEPSLYIRREKLSLQYVTKLAANPRNSAYDCVFNPKYERFYNNKPTKSNQIINITCQFIQMVRNKMRKLLVLLLVQILLTVSDYLIIAPFLPPKPRQLILHFTISEISLKNSLSFIQILFLY